MVQKLNSFGATKWLDGQVFKEVDIHDSFTQGFQQLLSLKYNYASNHYVPLTIGPGSTATMTRGLIYRFKNVNMSSGNIVTTGSVGDPLIIVCDNSALIGGVISLTGCGWIGGTGGNVNASTDAGSDGGCGSHAAINYFNYNIGSGMGGGGFGGLYAATGWVSGGSPGRTTTFNNYQAADIPNQIYNLINTVPGGGGGGGGAGGRNVAGVGGSGGNAGGTFILLAGGSVIISGAILANGNSGQPGNPGTANNGGGGGGGGGGAGGIVIIGYGDTYSKVGIINVSGGIGGSGAAGRTGDGGAAAGGGGGGGAGGTSYYPGISGLWGFSGNQNAFGGSGGNGGDGGAGSIFLINF